MSKKRRQGKRGKRQAQQPESVSEPQKVQEPGLHRSDQKSHRVAIIAVHGVADQRPGETAQGVADLLAQTSVRELVFEESQLRIPLGAVKPHRLKSTVPTPDSRWQSTAEISIDANKKHDNRFAESSARNIEYSRMKLARYEPGDTDSTYDTVRLSAVTDDGTAIDVYESYWADLSRTGNRITRVALEFYQLLFFLCGLSRAIHLNGRKYQNGPIWWCQRASTALAARLVTLAIPAFNLCLFATLTFLIPYVPGLTPVQSAWAVAFLESWPVLLLLFGITACALWLVGRTLNATLPGAVWCFPLSIGLVTLTALGIGYHSSYFVNADATVIIGAVVAESSLYCLIFAWSLYTYSAFSVSFFAWILQLCGLSPEERRASWTAQLGVIVPGLLTMILNLGIWYAISVVGTSVMSTNLDAAQHTPSTFGRHVFALGDEIDEARQQPRNRITRQRLPIATVSLRRMINNMNAVSAVTLFPVIVCLILILIHACWEFLPAIMTEGVHPFRRDVREPEAKASRLGKRLTVGFRQLGRTSRILLPLALALMIIVGGFAALDARWSILNRGTSLPGDLKPNPDAIWNLRAAGLGSVLDSIYYGSWWTSAAIGTVISMMITGVLSACISSIRGIVDIGNDVANWLRMFPVNGNPTSRIMSRYVALLNQLETAPDGQKYDVLIIVAHSLGTLVTVDTLRLLKAEPKICPKILSGGTEVHLVTFGSPLQQLVGLRLPYLYGWCRNDMAPDDQLDASINRIDELAGVSKWTNCYCSGDYVGRSLWHADYSPTRWDLDERSVDDQSNGTTTQTRTEVCIGPGAHTAYWKSVPGKLNRVGKVIAKSIGLETIQD